jgi:hypothetical protein
MKRNTFIKINNMRKLILFLSILSINPYAFSQSLTDYQLGSGLHFESKDQSYSFDLGGVLLPQISLKFIEGEDAQLYYGAKRTFFDFGASALDEGVKAYFLTDFTASIPLLEAWVSFIPHKDLVFTMGQMKSIANNREMLISEPHLALFDRSMLSQSFNQTGREFGLSVSYQFGSSEFAIVPKIQMTSGDGLNSFGQDSRDVDLGGLKYAARVDLYPLGLFKEGQLESLNDYLHENELKVLFGASGSYNDGASQAVGEGHGDFYLFNSLGQVMLPDYRELNIDFVSKYKGFSLLAEYSISTATGLENLYTESLIQAFQPQALQPTEIASYLALGSGLSTHFYYTSRSGYSIGLVYSQVKSEFDRDDSILKNSKSKTLVLSKRIANSSVTLQNTFSIIDVNSQKNIQNQCSIQLCF